MSNFNNAIETILTHEGGYVNNPNDPGGETNFGISRRTYPQLDIKNLTQAQASSLYFQDWWEKYGYGRIQDQHLATKVFDAAVNLGAVSAHKLLQQALIGCGNSVIVDGILGSATIATIQQTLAGWLLDRYRLELTAYYLKLYQKRPRNLEFLAGWIKRAIS